MRILRNLISGAAPGNADLAIHSVVPVLAGFNVYDAVEVSGSLVGQFNLTSSVRPPPCSDILAAGRRRGTRAAARRSTPSNGRGLRDASKDFDPVPGRPRATLRTPGAL